ncbi:MAG: signal peptidase I [Candidatus Bathyarchaeota archaeon]|jgi:signal peptidase
MADLKKIWKNEYVQTAIVIIVVVGLVFGLWYGSQIILNTQYPALAVASGSMCTIQHTNCDGSSHPFEPTLHVGDLIIVQGIPPTEINAAPYPDGDIIVFRRGRGLIVHRAIEKELDGDRIKFTTKGDGNLHADAEKVDEENVIGKVILRIPWIGHVALLMRNSSGMFIIVILIIILIAVEFVMPMLSRVKTVWSDREEKENQLKKDEA